MKLPDEAEFAEYIIKAYDAEKVLNPFLYLMPQTQAVLRDLLCNISPGNA